MVANSVLYMNMLYDQRQFRTWTNADLLLIRPMITNFNEIGIKIRTFSFTEMRLKMASARWRPFCSGLKVLIYVRWFKAIYNRQLIVRELSW